MIAEYAARHAHNPDSPARQWPVGYPWTVGYARNYRPRHGKRGAR